MSDTAELGARLQEALGAEYQVEQPLGSGGFAVVYLVRDLNLKRKLAVKVLSPDLISSKTMLERFRREAETIAQLAHPHIVPLHFIGQKDDLIYLAMQCIEGGSLADRLESEGPLPLEEASRILREIASALDYAHKHGVVHRDIKPHNVLLEAETGRALLTDFGIARTAEGASLTATGMLVGTPAYLSPEQVAGEPSDHRADIYALGVVAYEMVAGKPPFTGTTPTAVLLMRLAGPPPSLEKLRPTTPVTLRRTIEGMLASKPEERFQSAGDVVRSLTGSGPALKAPARPRPRWLLPSAGALVLLAAAGLGWKLLKRTPPTPAAVDPGMVIIPTGSYLIGDPTDRLARPVHQVQLTAFGIDVDEVTVGAYAELVKLNRVMAPWKVQPDSLLPVTGVSHAEAMKYCTWKHPPDGRLPTEEEWEAAARGLAGRRFPWGDAWRPGAANTGKPGGGPEVSGSNSGGATPEGVRNLVGNVWEWTMSPMVGYPGNPLPDSLARYYVIRGGAFDTPDSVARPTLRGYARPSAELGNLSRTGFRCVMPLRGAKTP